MIESIINAILNKMYKLRIHCETIQESRQVRRECEEKIKALQNQNSSEFENAIATILQDKYEYLNTEEFAIKLECVGIYGKRDFKLRIYDICFEKGILLPLVVKSILSDLNEINRKADQYAELDYYSYKGYLITLMSDNDTPPMVREFFLTAIDLNSIHTLEDLQLFVLLNKKDVAKIRKYKTLCSVATEIAKIQNEGLVCWCQEVKPSKIKTVFSTLNKYVSKEFRTVYDELCLVLNKYPREEYLSLPESACDEIIECENKADILMDLNLIDVLIANFLHH